MNPKKKIRLNGDEGKYRKGWDVIRKERFAKQQKLGVIPDNAKLSPPDDNINKFRGPYRRDIYKYRSWDAISEKEQEELDLEMAVFAAMVDNMDQGIGRIVDALKAQKIDVTYLTVHSELGHDSFLLEPELYSPYLKFLLNGQ